MRTTPTLAIMLGLFVALMAVLLLALPGDACAQQPGTDAAYLRVPMPEEGDERIPGSARACATQR
ncbi:hypothetical protein [Candidatus Palauibacter sp.]|uniref:hypothetical protein n=1 Tax=Candidatus Palauibacter sp. TaxID=3101350 RepID=UPI003B529D93